MAEFIPSGSVPTLNKVLVEADPKRAHAFLSRIEHLKPVQTPTTFALTVMEPSTSQMANPDVIQLVSPLGGKAVELEWDHDSPPIKKVNVWLTVIREYLNKFAVISTAFQNHKDEDGNIRPLTLTLPDLSKPLDPSDPTEFGNTLEERYFNKFKRIVSVFSQSVKELKNPREVATMHEGKCWCKNSCDILGFICKISYDSAVTYVKSLNSHYAPFSSEVNGETKNKHMELIIDQLKFNEDDVFMDLGSGVGQLVVYVAGATKVKKAIGIEKAKLPATYARNMETEFMNWMSFFNKKYSKFELHNNDFLAKELRELIQSATIIFINNLAFKDDLEEKIKYEIINNLAPGTRIVTTKKYASGKGARGGMDNILDMVELMSVKTPASWTNTQLSYYQHTVNPAKLPKYFDAQMGKAKQPRKANGQKKKATQSRKADDQKNLGTQSRKDDAQKEQQGETKSPRMEVNTAKTLPETSNSAKLEMDYSNGDAAVAAQSTSTEVVMSTGMELSLEEEGAKRMPERAVESLTCSTSTKPQPAQHLTKNAVYICPFNSYVRNRTGETKAASSFHGPASVKRFRRGKLNRNWSGRSNRKWKPLLNPITGKKRMNSSWTLWKQIRRRLSPGSSQEGAIEKKMKTIMEAHGGPAVGRPQTIIQQRGTKSESGHMASRLGSV